MEHCATHLLRFETAPLELEAAFDGGRITSDDGLLWLAQIDGELGLCEAIASHVPEWRSQRSVRHSLATLVRQTGLPDSLRLRGPKRRRHAAH